jgi:hypothetical protein
MSTPFTKHRFASLITYSLIITSCTGQIPGSFRYLQQLEAFDATGGSGVNTKLDMLWVMDNTPSMGPSQKKVRDGLRTFADRYMKPNWDIRVAVISQDTYLANPAFRDFLNDVAPTPSSERYSREAGYQSSYLNPNSAANPRRTTAFVTPASWVTAAISANGTVTGGGVKLRHGIPEYGGANAAQDVSAANPSQWARLIPGRHDGPLGTMCWTSNNNAFFFGISQCHVRDQQDVYSGTANCVLGGTGNMDSAVQCVNTLMNNTVRSGKPIISTKPPEGVPGDAVWTEQIFEDFLVNLSGGVSGYPLEKYFGSIQQLLTDNESAGSNTKFFRPDALRAIVIVTDEDDQSTTYSPTVQITPESQYDPNNSCPFKTVDGHTYRLQICPQTNKLLSVNDFKNQMDSFFRTLDGNPTGDPNYFVVTISPTTGQTVQDLQDLMGENYNSVSSDYGTRLFAFSDAVGNGSLRLEITNTDYTPMLDAIGQVIVQKKSSFQLQRPPTSQEEMIVWILHADGSTTILSPSQYTISGTTLTITDTDLVLSLTSTDRIYVDYQPSQAF